MLVVGASRQRAVRRTCGAPMTSDEQDQDTARCIDSARAMSRRTFGHTVGAAVMGGTLQAAGGDAPSGETPRESEAVHVLARGDDLCHLDAIELAARIRGKQVSAREVMSAHLAQIERVNPSVNAIVTLVAERAMADAARADEQLARGGPLGPASRASGCAQGPRRHGRDSHHAWLALLSRHRADG